MNDQWIDVMRSQMENTMSSSPRPIAAASVALSATLLAAAPSAHAQPNPFDAYEGKKQTEEAERAQQSSRQAEQSGPEETSPKATSFVSSALTTQGHWVAGGAGSFSYTTTSNETESGEESDNTLFVRIAPNLGFFILDRLEIGGSIGVLWRQIGRSDESSSVERDFLFEARGRYHLPVTQRFSLIPSASVGGYVGRSSREVQALDEDMNPTTIEEPTDTFGVSASLGLDIGYLLGPKLQLQAGLALVGLFGAESVPSEEESFRVSTFNTSLSIGVGYYF